MRPLEDPSPIIIGSVRSGTTLLCLMLNAHPELTMAFESYFLFDLLRQSARWERPDGVDVDAFAEQLLTDPRGERFRKRWAIPGDVIRARLSATDSRDAGEILRHLYRLYADDRGKPRAGEKTAGYLVGLPMLAALLPEARFVHIVRDGRDASVSHVAQRWGPDDLVAAGRTWATRVGELRAFGASLGPGRYREVRYEHLLADPATVLTDVCAFVGLAFSSDMLEFHRLGVGALTGVGTRGTHLHANLPPTVGLRDWRRDVATRDLARLEAAIGAALEELGYPRGVSRVPFGVRLELAARDTRRRSAAPFAALRQRLGFARGRDG